MTTASIELRPCVSTDVALAVPLIYSSGPDAFDFVFKSSHKSAQDFLKFAFQKEGGEFSYDNHHGLFKNDKLIGIGALFSAKKAKSFTRIDAINIVRHYGWKSANILSKGLQIEKVIKLPIKRELALGHLGIHPTEQSKGYGEKLIHALVETRTINSGDVIVLDVSKNNPRAQALYERLGFQISHHRKSTLRNAYGVVADHFRMERKA